MMRLLSVSAAVAVLAALAVSSAAAKGANEATITGPGLGGGITLTAKEDAAGGRLATIAESAGFFPGVFLRSPNPMRSTQPPGELGPRYTVVYAMPGPNGVDRVRQYLYPFAKPSPVTYMNPGQRFFGTEKTVGGWYVSTATLKDELVAAGLPETPPGGSHRTMIRWLSGAAAGAVAVAGAVVLLLRRRRSRAAEGSPHTGPWLADG